MVSRTDSLATARRAVLTVLGRHPVRWAMLFGALAVVVAALCGWPHWRGHPGAAAITLAECGGTAAVGVLLATGRGTRRTGLAAIVVAFCWGAVWLAAWNAGAGPLISVFAQSCFFLFGGIGTLYYPDGRLHGWPERTWAPAAAVVLLGGQAALCVTASPEKFGFDRQVTWPRLVHSAYVESVTFDVVASAGVALAASFAAVLWWRGRRLRGVERTLALPVLAFIAVVGTVAALTASTPPVADLDAYLDIYLAQGSAFLLVPLALFSVGLRRRWAEVAIADRLLRLTDPPTAERVRAALREVLREPTLELYFWVPRQDEYVDLAGRAIPPVAAPAEGESRWRLAASTQQGTPLAVIEADANLRRQESLVQAALDASRRALENAQLHAEVQARIEQVRAAQMRVLQAEAAERQRMERDLHDGAQQRLVGLAMRLAAVEQKVAEPDAKDAVRKCREAATEALAELRAFVRGIHPGRLADEGLASALESLAERLGLSMSLQVSVERPSPGLERAMYLALAEAMTNAARHAEVDEITVRLWSAGQHLVGEVIDAGIGGAKVVQGGGLAGVQDRARALRGEVDVIGRLDGGTRIRVWLPTWGPGSVAEASTAGSQPTDG